MPESEPGRRWNVFEPKPKTYAELKPKVPEKEPKGET